jgi:hypothetical protein
MAGYTATITPRSMMRVGSPAISMCQSGAPHEHSSNSTEIIMPDKTYDMSGALFKNRDKQEGDNKPHYRGDITISGTRYRLAAWLKEGRAGKFLSIAASLKDAASQASDNNKPKPQAPAAPLSDEIPF